MEDYIDQNIVDFLIELIKIAPFHKIYKQVFANIRPRWVTDDPLSRSRFTYIYLNW
jgi:hypothetical protein